MQYAAGRLLTPIAGTTPSLDLSFMSGALPSNVTFTRASTAWTYNSSGVLTSHATNTPRFSYNPLTLDRRGLLIEEARTNLFGNSTNLAYSFWSLANIFARTPYAGLAPDGTWTATLLEDNSTAAAQYVDATLTIPGTDTNYYTWSCFVKAGTSDLCHLRAYMTGGTVSLGSGIGVNFTFSSKTLGTPSGTGGQGAASVSDAGYTELPNGWFRVWVRIQNNNTGNVTLTCRLFAQNTSSAATGTIYAWGAQAELGSFQSSIIITTPTWTSRASTATYHDASGVLTTAASGAARSGYRYDGTTWVSAGTILEAAGTNQMPGTMTGGTYWQGAGTTIATGQTAPDGTTNALLLTESAGGVITYGASPLVGVFGTMTSGQAVTASLYAKAGTCSWLRFFLCDTTSPTYSVVGWFNLATGALGTLTAGGGATQASYAIQNVGGGFYRCSVSGVLSTATTCTMLIRMASGDNVTTDAGSKTMTVFGPQLEVNASPTSYIPTTTAAASRVADGSSQASGVRAADVASVTSLGTWFNAAEGTALGEFALNSVLTQNSQTILSIDDATANERYTIRCGSTNGIIGWVVVDGGVTQVGTSQTAPAVTVTNKFAGAYAVNDFAGCLNGSVSTDTAGTLPTVTRMTIGSRLSADYLNGYVRRIRIYDRRLPNSTLQAITA